jgi:hypothetical protein
MADALTAGALLGRRVRGNSVLDLWGRGTARLDPGASRLELGFNLFVGAVDAGNSGEEQLQQEHDPQESQCGRDERVRWPDQHAGKTLRLADRK